MQVLLIAITRQRISVFDPLFFCCSKRDAKHEVMSPVNMVVQCIQTHVCKNSSERATEIFWKLQAGSMQSMITLNFMGEEALDCSTKCPG